MSTINTSNNANVAYNYQKVPGLVNSNLIQSQAGLVISMRDKPNTLRNVSFLFPGNMTTPNYGAGSPTLLSNNNTIAMPENIQYAGRQVSY